MIAPPPLEAGAVQDTWAEASPATADAAVGASGRRRAGGAAWTLPVPESVKVLPAIGQELPVVGRGVERQLQHAVGGGVADLARGEGRPGARLERRAAGADGELADAVDGSATGALASVAPDLIGANRS